jgi:FKBP-type peptidyl-prolyl cis-trans isomerase SlyD
MDNETIEAGKVVSIHYTLTDESSEVLDTSGGSKPIDYLHGAQNIVPGLEEGLVGKRVGDTLHVRVAPDKGYGQRDERGVQKVPREVFPADAELVEGMQFLAEGPGGESIPVWVVGVEPSEITVDANHPLAGKVLDFEVTVAAVRDATAEELTHGHPHGPDGHHDHHHEH